MENNGGKGNINIMDYIELSSSDDDVPLNVRIANRTGSSQTPAASQGEDPEWVRSFTPQRPDSPKQEVSDYSDEDFINIVPQSQSQSEPNFSQGASQGASQEPIRKKKNGNGSSRAPTKSELTLVTAPRLDEGLALLQVEENELNLSGDVGAVGRVKIDGSAALLDIKGTLFRGLPYVCNSACVMAVADDEARISAVMNTAVLLEAEENVFAEEDGVVDGHTFEDGMDDSDSTEMDGEGRTANGKGKKVGKSAGNGTARKRSGDMKK